MTADKPRRLGRGLEALLAQSPAAQQSAPAGTTDGVQRIPLGQVRPSPYQPRRSFEPTELADLEMSLKASGLLQPITVRPLPGGGWELIAGERRLRAAQRLGWPEIPALVRDVDDRTALTLALVENLQRADLNPVEEAQGYRRLVDEFELTQQQVADVVGKDRSTVANALRLLNLPEAVQLMLRDGRLTLGHARALLALQSDRAMTELAHQTVARGLSVRDVERLTRAGAPAAPRKARKGSRQTGTPETRRMQEELRRRLQTDVKIQIAGAEKGSIRIEFYSADDLERVLEIILGERREW